MIEKRLHEITSKLDNVFKSADAVEEDEIKSHLARYLCVLTSGYLEESMKVIIEYYTSSKASPSVTNYIIWSTRNLTNLNTEKIEQFLNTFNNQWKNEFKRLLTDEEKDAIDSVVANRNNIAHGRNVGVSYIRVRSWYENVKKVVESIRLILSI